MALLFEKFSTRQVTLKNRIVVSPMCQYSSQDGLANDWHLVHLGARAVGGASLVFTEAAAVEPAGRISPHDLGLWSDEQIPMLKRITSFIHSRGAATGIQLAHAGRKASTAIPWSGQTTLTIEQGGWPTVAPSAVAFDKGYSLPKALSSEEIEKLVTAFVQAAQRAIAAGFDVIEIHAAHGYLIDEFLSPISNQRTDSYGGRFDNRIRFLREVVQGIRQVWTEERPLFVRLSTTDWLEPQGWTVEQSVALAKILKTDGVDLIDCSSGGIAPNVTIPIGAGYQTPLADRVRREAGIATGAVGMITTASQAETILRTGQADLIFFAREFLRDPYFALHAAKELHTKPAAPDQYRRAF